MDAEFDFSEGAFSKVAGEHVVADGAAALEAGAFFSVSHE